MIPTYFKKPSFELLQFRKCGKEQHGRLRVPSSYTSKYSLKKLQLQLSITGSFLSLQVFTSRGNNKHNTLYKMYVHVI